MIASLLVIASSGLSSPNWSAGLEHFGCAAYVQKVWKLTDVQKAQVDLPQAMWEELYLQHIEKGREFLIPVIKGVDPSSKEGELVSALVGMPLDVGAPGVVDVLLSTILNDSTLRDELAETKQAGPVEVARLAVRRYDAQKCKALLEAAE